MGLVVYEIVGGIRYDSSLYIPMVWLKIMRIGEKAIPGRQRDVKYTLHAGSKTEICSLIAAVWERTWRPYSCLPMVPLFSENYLQVTFVNLKGFNSVGKSLPKTLICAEFFDEINVFHAAKPGFWEGDTHE